MSVTSEHATGRVHQVYFYAGADALGEAAAGFLGPGLAEGRGALVVATPAHRRAIERHLAAAGVDVAVATAEGRLLLADAAEACGELLVDGRIDEDRFETIVGDRVRHLADAHGTVNVYGEIVALLWEDGRVREVMELEALWSALGERIAFSLLCGYPSAGVDDREAEDLCAVHTGLLGRRTAGPRTHMAARTFAGKLVDARRARRFTLDTLVKAGRRAVAADAALVVAELAANAIVHARSAFTVTVSSAGDRITVTVRDDSPTAPSPRHPGRLEPSGLGLRLVAALASDWGTQRDGCGKVVWAELDG